MRAEAQKFAVHATVRGLRLVDGWEDVLAVAGETDNGSDAAKAELYKTLLHNSLINGRVHLRFEEKPSNGQIVPSPDLTQFPGTHREVLVADEGQALVEIALTQGALNVLVGRSGDTVLASDLLSGDVYGRLQTAAAGASRAEIKAAVSRWLRRVRPGRDDADLNKMITSRYRDASDVLQAPRCLEGLVRACSQRIQEISGLLLAENAAPVAFIHDSVWVSVEAEKAAAYTHHFASLLSAHNRRVLIRGEFNQAPLPGTVSVYPTMNTLVKPVGDPVEWF
jgi:hypothetical protein